jgi:hypothetical protein
LVSAGSRSEFRLGLLKNAFVPRASNGFLNLSVTDDNGFEFHG